MRGPDAVGEVAVDFVAAALGQEVTVHLEGRGALHVKVPPGAADGTKIRLAGQGGAGAEGGAPGDLYLTLRLRPHAFFKRDGADILVDVPVTIPELVLGASIEVPTLEAPLTMKIPAGSSNGRKLRLRGKGALQRKSGSRGDLYVILDATLPSGDDPRIAELAKEMKALYADENVRARLGMT